MLRVACIGVLKLRLSFVILTWRHAVRLLEQSAAFSGLKEEARAMQGKLALLREQRQRQEESAALDVKRADDEAGKKLALAQRKLSAGDERRRFLERDLQLRAAEVDAVRSELQPYREQQQQLVVQHEAALATVANEIRSAELATMRTAKGVRTCLLRSLLTSRHSPRLSSALHVWSAAVPLVKLDATRTTEAEAAAEAAEAEAAAAAAAAEALLGACREERQQQLAALTLQMRAKEHGRRTEVAEAVARESTAQRGALELEARLTKQVLDVTKAREAAEGRVEVLGAALEAARADATTAEAAAAAREAELVRALEAASEEAAEERQSREEYQARSEASCASAEETVRVATQAKELRNAEGVRQAFMMLQLIHRAARRLRLSCALRLWEGAASMIDMQVRTYVSQSVSKQVSWYCGRGRPR